MKLQEKFHDIVAALQNELQEYGGLLHLFDRQQKCIVHQDPTGFLDINVDVDEQMVTGRTHTQPHALTKLMETEVWWKL